MTRTDDVVRAVLETVARLVGPSRVPSNAGADTRLGEGYWLDSVEMLELVLACEQQFGITFEPSTDLTPEALSTVGSLSTVVYTRLRAAQVRAQDQGHA